MFANSRRILIVDDEQDLCEILQYNLNNAGYQTEVAHSAEEAYRMPIHSFDLLLLDVMMGPMSGFELAEIIRKNLKLNTPIIFLTAKDKENDILTGFNLDADDYITKPFIINELNARVRAVLKRTQKDMIKTDPVNKSFELELDIIKKQLIINGKEIDLTRREYEILNLLINDQRKVFSREDLLRIVWGPNVVVSERTVDVNIARLRKKIGKFGNKIKNKSGYGYYFEF